MKACLSSASVLALILSAPTVLAQTFDLGEIVVFANQTETEADRVGVTVEVLDAQEIATSPTASVAQTLSRLPGVATNSNGGQGKLTQLRIRGLNDRYIGVRINGFDVSDPGSTQTAYNWGGLSGAGLSSIEVLKGTHSALYGSEAIAGVINITSYRPTENGTFYRYGLELGSFNTRRADFSVGQKTDRAMVALTLSRVVTDSFSSADENQGNTETDPYRGTTVLLSARYALNDQVTVGFEGLYEEQETNIDAGGGVGGDANRPFFTDRAGARVYAEIDAGAFQHEVGISYFKTKRADPLTTFGSPNFESRRTEVRWTATTDLDRGPLTFGIEYSHEEADFSNGTADYDTISLFAEHQIALSERLDLTLSARADDHSEFGSAVTGRIAAAWRPSSDTVIRGSLATGYRAPSLNELFGPFNTAVINPQLEPEESRSAEVSIERRFAGGGRVQAAAFYTQIDDVIDYISSPTPPFQGAYTQIPGTTTAKGLELSGRFPVTGAVSVFGSYTFTDSERPDGTRERRVPEHDIVLGIDADFDNGWGGQFVVNRAIGRVDGFFPVDVPDYTVASLQINYDVTDAANLYLRVENLFDEEYQTAIGYGTSDRAVYFGVRGSF
ncbi:TonB-dependent receptor [Aestuariivita sp.]|jgi:vitamin B12 transporter|uniref:TonB-dependent receptor plug domain-containing protein n=1 Tax=Aestuariivita sp. TaxID=1872407 RepID=UPI00216FB20E|nr:TonB-dependent receptor [Aestuariivita sp.]MCE8007852.1 TonB-dependent receptor [Aestuariivita sp.]